MTEPAFFNKRQLAERWSVQPRTIDRYMRAGIAPSMVRIRGKVLFPLAAVLAVEEVNALDTFDVRRAKELRALLGSDERPTETLPVS